MNKGNTTLHPEEYGLSVSPVWPGKIMFCVTTTQEITTPRGRTIPRGAHVFIDPAREPATESDLVLVGDLLEPWRGQPHIQGVASHFGSAV